MNDERKLLTLEKAGQLRIAHEQPSPQGYWRTVNEGEILPAGGHYRLNMDGGPAQVWEPGPVPRTGNGQGVKT